MPKLKVTITTLHSVYTSKNAKLFIKFIGDGINSKPVPLKYKYGWEDSPLFRPWEKEPDSTDLFSVTRPKRLQDRDDDDDGKQTFRIKVPRFFNLNAVQKIEIGFDNSRFVDGWLIGSVSVEDSKRTILFFNGPGTYGYWHHGSMTLTAERFLKIEDSFLPNRFVMGPILGFRGTSEYGRYQLSCLLVSEGLEAHLDSLEFTVTTTDGTQTIGSGRTNTLTRPIALCGRYKLWRYDWEVPRDRNQNFICKYTLPDHRSFSCHIPAFNTYPRVAFATFSAPDTEAEARRKSGKVKFEDNSNVMWIHMRNAHKEKPFHLLLLGGNNVNADVIVQELLEERRMSGLDDYDVSGLRNDARRKYFEMYISQWRQPEQSCMMARIPTLMMWDEQDIFSGWGSVSQSIEEQEIFKAAKEYFISFQLKGFRTLSARAPHVSVVDVHQLSVTWLHPPSVQLREPYHDPGPFSHVLTFGDVGFLLLDHRSERTIDRIMSEDTWRELTGILDVIHGTKHIFVVIPVPIIFVESDTSTSTLFKKSSHKSSSSKTSSSSSKTSSKQTIKIVEKGGRRKKKKVSIKESREGFSDGHDDGDHEVANQWTSPYHDFERKRLIKLLLDFSRRKRVKVTILSGDAHVGCWGKIEAESDISIDVVTLSSISSPPMKTSFFGLHMMRHHGTEFFCLPEHGRVRLTLEEITETGFDNYVIAAQNFLILDPQTTSLGQHTGRYDATFVKRPDKLYEKTKPKRLLLTEPKKYTKVVEAFLEPRIV
ncbi:uncharacterized protein [Ptychodera flava]|uniref:uncharacterized protein n=1 Tax=Ptychodera flava TaxID=63121 RepID=UPI00396A1201